MKAYVLGLEYEIEDVGAQKEDDGTLYFDAAANLACCIQEGKVKMAKKYLASKWCDGFAPQRKQNNEKGYARLKEIEEQG